MNLNFEFKIIFYKNDLSHEVRFFDRNLNQSNFQLNICNLNLKNKEEKDFHVNKNQWSKVEDYNLYFIGYSDVGIATWKPIKVIYEYIL